MLRKTLYIILCLTLVQTASAVGVGVTPAELNFSVQIGSSDSKVLYVINTGSEDSGYRVYVDEKYRDWFTVSPENFTLAPDAHKAVQISLSPPISASGNFNILIYAVSYSPSSEFNVGGGIKVPANVKVSNSGLLLISGILITIGLVYYIGQKKRISIARMATAGIGVVLLIMPAMAAWNYDGYEVKTMESGSIKGDVFISYGDKSGIGSSPYTSNFNVPAGTEKYSRLYVGIWGGTETKTGTLSTTLNNNNLGVVNIGGTGDTNPTYTTGTNVYGRGNGVWWVSYNVTGNNVTMGDTNSATATTGGTIDGRIYAIMLVTVYDSPSEPLIQYWINEGSYNLHYSSASYPYVQDKTFVWFNGASITHASAILSTAYLVGGKGEPDYLYFNPPNVDGSPYGNMVWDIAEYEEYQLGDKDVADGSQGEYFDFETFISTNEKPLNDLILDNNYAVFWRGHDDNNDGKIYAEFTPTNSVEGVEGESYVGPVLAVLILSTGAETKGYPDLTIYNVEVPIVSTGKVNTISATIENIGKGPAYGGSAALYVDGTLVSSASVSSLNAGKNKTVDFSWKPANEGKYALWVSADPNNAIKELHETNNNNTPLTVNVIDFTPPKLTISRPMNGEVLDDDIIMIRGNVEDASKNIRVTVNGVPASLSGTGWNAMVSLSQGYNKIIVSAMDGANNTATEFIEIKSKGIHSTDMESTAESIGETNLTANGTATNKIGRPFFMSLFTILALIALVYWLKRRSS